MQESQALVEGVMALDRDYYQDKHQQAQPLPEDAAPDLAVP